MIQHQHVLNLWRSLIADGDLPDEIAADVKAALRTYDKADDLLIVKAKQHRELSNEMVNVRRSAPDLIHDLIAAGKKPTVEAASEQITTLETAVADLEQQKRIAERATLKAGTVLTDGIARRHRELLIAWVAARRMVKPHACGRTELISEHLEAVWNQLNVTLYPKHDELLTIPGNWMTLPVVIESAWSRDVRSSVAWCWKQIAEGRWEWEAHPNDRAGVKRLMRFTALPIGIEQAPELTAKRQRRLTFGFGQA